MRGSPPSDFFGVSKAAETRCRETIHTDLFVGLALAVHDMLFA